MKLFHLTVATLIFTCAACDFDTVGVRRKKPVTARTATIVPTKSINNDDRKMVYTEWSFDGQKLLALSGTRGIFVWNTLGEPVFNIQNDSLWIAPHFSHDSKKIVISEENVIKIISADDGKTLSTMTGHAYAIVEAQFSPDDKRVFSVGSDNTIRLWNVNDGKELLSQTFKGGFHFSDWSPAGDKIATMSNNDIVVWDVNTGAVSLTLRPRATLASGASYFGPRFSPDGKKITTPSGDKNVTIWDATKGKELFTLEGHDDWTLMARFSPDSSKIITLTVDGVARIWDASSGQLLVNLQDVTPQIKTANFSPDSQRLVVTRDDNNAYVLDVNTGARLLILAGHKDKVNSAAFSPDGKQIVTASDDKTIKIWKVQ